MSLLSFFGLAKRSQQSFPHNELVKHLGRPKHDMEYCVDGADACSIPAFWSACRLLQTTMGRIKGPLYKELPDGGRIKDKTNPDYKILNFRPNPAQSRSRYWEYVIKEIVFTGNSYTLVRRTGEKQLIGLYPIPTSAVEKVEIDSEWHKIYHINIDGRTEIFDDTEVIHLFFFSEDGFEGKSVIYYAALALGLMKQLQKSAISYFRNAVKPSVYVKMEGNVHKDICKQISDDITNKYQGVDKFYTVPVLPNNGEIISLTSESADDQKLIEALAQGTDVIAQLFNISPLQLGKLDRGTYSNLAADNAAFYQKTIKPITEAFELEINYVLYGDSPDNYMEFDYQSILQGDPFQMADIHTKYLQAGVITRNEVREDLNMNKIVELETPLHPLNQGPTTNQPTKQPEVTNETSLSI